MKSRKPKIPHRASLSVEFELPKNEWTEESIKTTLTKFSKPGIEYITTRGALDYKHKYEYSITYITELTNKYQVVILGTYGITKSANKTDIVRRLEETFKESKINFRPLGTACVTFYEEEMENFI
jgi:hypothetical protein